MLIKGFEPIIELTAKQKHELYVKALELFNAGVSPYLCNCIYKSFSTKWYHMEYEEVMPLFTEFYQFIMVRGKGKWFPEEEKTIRRNILETCISASSANAILRVQR